MEGDSDPDLPSFLSELERIREEICDNLAVATLISVKLSEVLELIRKLEGD